MALQKQNFSVIFDKGLDRVTDEKAVLASQFTRMENLEWRDTNTVRQRPGYSPAVLTPRTINDRTVVNPHRLSALGADVLVEAASGLHSLTAQGSTSHPQGLGGATPSAHQLFERCKATITDIASSQQFQYHVDSAKLGNLECVVWSELDPGAATVTSYYLIRDLTFGLVLQQGAIGAGINPRVIVRTTRFIIFMSLTSSAAVVAYKIVVTTGSPGVIAGESNSWVGHASGIFDVWYDDWTDTVGLAYKDSTAVRVVTAALAGGDLATIFTTTNVLIGGGILDLSVCTDGYGAMLVACAEGSANIYAISMDLATGAVTAGVAGAVGTSCRHVKVVADPNNNAALIFTEFAPYTAPEPFNRDISVRDCSWAGVFGATNDIAYRGLALAGRPAAYQVVGAVSLCVPLSLPTTVLQPALFLLKYSNAAGHPTSLAPTRNVLARLDRCGGGGTPLSLGGAGFQMCALARGLPLFVGGVDVSPLHVISVVLDFDAALPTVEAQGTLFMAGACPQIYDGFQTHEAGFHHYPEGVTAAVRAGGSMTLTATYQFCFLYEWQDARGKIHRSAPSVPVSLTLTAANASATLRFPFLRLTDKSSQVYGSTRNDVRIVCFRTAGNGAIFYRDVAAAGSDTANTLVSNVMGTWISDLSDAALISNELLPTTGGGLENMAFPSTGVLCTHQRRLFMAIPGGVQYTDEIDEGHLAPATNEVYQILTPEFGGAVVGLASMDEKLIIVCENQIYFVYGQGPNRLGQQNGFSLPEICSTQLGGLAGCPESLVVTPSGLWFMSSQRGLRLLNRSLQIANAAESAAGTNEVFAGSEVDALFAGSFNTVRGHCIPARSQIRWYLAGSEIGVVTFDYQQNQWAQHTNHNSLGGSCVAQGAFWHSDGTNVFKSNAAAGGLDVAVSTPQVLETAWLALAGIQGFQRIYSLSILAQAQSAGTVSIEEAYDYSPNYGAPIQNWPAAGLCQIAHQLTRQKCEAVRFRITITPGSSAEFLRLTSFAVSVGLKPGLNRVATTQRF